MTPSEQFANDLLTAIPDWKVLLGLEPEELGAKLLFLIKTHASFHPDSASDGLWQQPPDHQPQYPTQKKAEVKQALAEAWAWLRAQGLIIPTPGDGQNGHCILSRRARKFQNEAEFVNYATARLLVKEILHPKISGSVWMSFMRGEFDMSVLQAMKAVEVAVRDAAGLTTAEYGASLMRKAFHSDNGKLTDPQAESGERQALSDLFAGAMGAFKNPQSHRDVQLDNPAEAAEIVMLANHLLRIVDARIKANKNENP